MWTTLALMAALSSAPDQAAPLNLTHVRATYGPLGALRKDHSLLPGDEVFVAFDIEGVTVAADGRVLYNMATDVLDSKGKVVFRQEPRDLEAVNALGGTTLPAYAHLDVGLDSPPGEYTVRVTVTDRASKRTGTLTQKFQVKDKAFGLVRLTTTSDPDGRIPTSVFECGASLWVNCGVVGFERSSQGKADVIVELRILDEKGQPTLSKPFTGELGKDAPKTLAALPVQFHVGLNRAGKFTVEVKATDRTSKKSAVLAFPLAVVAPQ
jgi:hypothetical protein